MYYIYNIVFYDISSLYNVISYYVILYHIIFILDYKMLIARSAGHGRVIERHLEYPGIYLGYLGYLGHLAPENQAKWPMSIKNMTSFRTI